MVLKRFRSRQGSLSREPFDAHASGGEGKPCYPGGLSATASGRQKYIAMMGVEGHRTVTRASPRRDRVSHNFLSTSV